MPNDRDLRIRAVQLRGDYYQRHAAGANAEVMRLIYKQHSRMGEEIIAILDQARGYEDLSPAADALRREQDSVVARARQRMRDLGVQRDAAAADAARIKAAYDSVVRRLPDGDPEKRRLAHDPASARVVIADLTRRMKGLDAGSEEREVYARERDIVRLLFGAGDRDDPRDPRDPGGRRRPGSRGQG